MNNDLLWDAAPNGKPRRHERRIYFDGEAEAFLTQMEAEGFPISNLVNFLVKQARPLYDNRGYTHEGFRRIKTQICKPY